MSAALGQPFVQQLVISILLSLMICTPHSQGRVMKTARLTANQLYDNGARILFNVGEVSPNPPTNDIWNVHIASENSWQFIIILDSSFGFHNLLRSNIKLTLDIPIASTSALLTAFTTDNKHYISTLIPTDVRGRQNQIYPACDQSSIPAQNSPFGIGDIASIPTFYRRCDIAGGSCLNWRNMIPVNDIEFNTAYPITFTIEHDPNNAEVILYVDSPAFPPGFLQQCKFGADFISDNGLKIYIAGDPVQQSYVVSAFDITYTIQPTTVSPTSKPTYFPSIPTTSPTSEPTKPPTKTPTETPTNPTKLPTYFPSIPPTKSPSIEPSISPTFVPSNIPSIPPTRGPTNYPSFVPSNAPSIPTTPAPTNYPSRSPSNRPSVSPIPVPTNNPTFVPSNAPSTSPTPAPTNNPSRSPTGFPSTQPTILPTIQPTLIPTIHPSYIPSTSPTPKPSNYPTKMPTNNPSIPPTYIPTRNPSISPTNNPSTSPSHNPSQSPTYNPSTHMPSTSPTYKPSVSPSHAPSRIPTLNTASPTYRPTPVYMQWGAHDQLCLNSVANVNDKCRLATDTLTDTNGIIQCMTPYDCCMCNTIQCGFNGVPCREVTVFGSHAAYGVKNIQVSGDVYGVNGASIDCAGIASCKQSIIHGSNVNFIDCDANAACQNATITITNPKNGFFIECADHRSCAGLNINIILPPPPIGYKCNPRKAIKDIFTFSKITCNNNLACESLHVTIQNEGCKKVIIENIDCMQTNACNNAVFNLIGDISINNCQCGSSCANTIGLEQCVMDLSTYSCSEPYSCATHTKTITNPINGFKFLCSSTSACSNSNFIIQLNDSPTKLEPVEYFDAFIFSGPYSAAGAVFTIQNDQRGIFVIIGTIQCSGVGSCESMTFITGENVYVEQIICTANACQRCQIKQTVNSPALPCDAGQIFM